MRLDIKMADKTTAYLWRLHLYIIMITVIISGRLPRVKHPLPSSLPSFHARQSAFTHISKKKGKNGGEETGDVMTQPAMPSAHPGLWDYCTVRTIGHLA